MKAVEIINRALVLSGLVSRGLQQASGEQGKDGLFWLNQLLAEKSATGRMLPYYGHIEVTPTIGEKVVFFEGMVTADTFTFNIGDIRYPVKVTNRNRYFGEARAENINSLPYEWYWERVPGGINIYLYFAPGSEYPLKLTGLISFSPVTFDTEMNPIMDAFYQNFLMFELAESICLWSKISMPPATAAKLERLRKEVTDINPKDYTQTKISMYGGDVALSYAGINFAKNGWYP
jgi:hypothetical protein